LSNSHSNREQSTPLELSHNQQSPGDAKPEDFKVTHTFEKQTPLPGHGQMGDTQAEYRRLLEEGHEDFAPTPDRNEAPVIPYTKK